MAPHSSTLAWKIPWMEEPGGLQSMGSLGIGQTERLHFHFSLSRIGEGNSNPLQCSCLENPRDGGAWWAAVSGVAQSRTRLKRLSSSSHFLSLAKDLLVLFIFLNKQHLVLLILFIFFLFSLSVISTLLIVIFFLFLISGLICSSFEVVLKLSS